MDINSFSDVMNGETKSIYGWIRHWAAEKGPDCALILVDKDGSERNTSWAELLSAVDKTSLYFHDLGLCVGSRVAVAMPNSLSGIVSALAAWHLGCCVFFLSPELPDNELEVLLSQIQPQLVVALGKHAGWSVSRMTESFIASLPEPQSSLPDISALPARATATGGSTGTPKIIIEDIPMSYGPVDFVSWQMLTGQHAGQRLLVCGSLHHSHFGNNFYIALGMGNTNILMRQFNEELFLKLVEKHKVNAFVLVPTMMSRIIRSLDHNKVDLSSVECMHHAGAACPVWLKKDWIKLLGGEKVYEFYSMSEKIGITAVRGDEWLLHEGCVGRPFGCTVEILDDDMNPVENGTVGNVFFKMASVGTSHYLMDTQKLTLSPSGSVSVGDLGYIDDDGFVYLVDRRSDMIITGGKNVFATEVENVIKECPQVADALVIGLTDVTWGRRVHAIIEPVCPPEEFKLYSFADFGFRRISNYKLPKSIELVDRIPRDQNGKVNKRRLVDEREASGEDSGKFKFITVPNGHQIYAWRKKKAAQKKKESQQS